MSSPSRLRLPQTAAIASVAIVVTLTIAATTTVAVFDAVVIGILVGIVRALDRNDGPAIGFESAIVLGSAIAYHDWAVPLIAVACGAGIRFFITSVREPHRTMHSAAAAAQLTACYGIVALLYAEAVERNARIGAKLSGFVLLIVGCTIVQLVFWYGRRHLEQKPTNLDVRRMLREVGRLVIACTPIIVAEVLLFMKYGLGGFLAGALPSLIVTFAARRQIEQERRNVDLIRRNRELSILTEHSTEILGAADDEETFRRLVSILGKLATMRACTIVSWTHVGEQANVYRFGECQPNDQEILRWVEAAGVADSAPSHAFVFQNDQRRFPLSSGPAVQLIIGIQTAEVIYGVMIFETSDATILRTERLNVLTLLVNQTAVALQDQLLRSEMQQKTRSLEAHAERTSAILDLATGLIGTFDLDGALTRVAQTIRTSLGFDSVLVALYDPKHDAFVRSAQAGLEDVWNELRKQRVPADSIIALRQEQFRLSRSYYVPAGAMQMSERDFVVKRDQVARTDEWHEHDQLIVPLLRGDEVLGYLSVRGPRDRRVPNEETVRTLEIFAVQAVMAIQSARQFQQIERLTFLDALTPAFNHRYFQDALQKEMHRSGRTGQEFALAMLDIDNFKRINDSFGHPIGDEVLKGVVEELQVNGRESDVVSRYGGEEFAIIFPGTAQQSARDAANRLRELIERRHFDVPQVGRTIRITVSIGVAVYPRDGVTSADLIARADAALYLAKKSGKNRVAVAADLQPGAQFAL